MNSPLGQLLENRAKFPDLLALALVRTLCVSYAFEAKALAQHISNPQAGLLHFRNVILTIIMIIISIFALVKYYC